MPRRENEERVVITCLERLSVRSDYTAAYRLSDELSREVVTFVASENDRLNERYIQGDDKLKAQSAAYRTPDNKILSEVDIAAALATFERELVSPRARLLTLDYALRAFLRMHAKPVHSALHQLKRVYRSQVYRK